MEFHFALFSDKECTQRVSDIKEIVIDGTYSGSVTFENLSLNQSYYVAETDAEGNAFDTEGSENEYGLTWSITGDHKAEVSLIGANTASTTITNDFPSNTPPENFLDVVNELEVTKHVTLGGQDTDSISGTFYVTLFSDEDLTNIISETQALEVKDGKDAVVTFTELPDGVYYVAETDADGTPVSQLDFAYTVSYDNSEGNSFSVVSFDVEDAEDDSQKMTITNDQPEEEESEEEENEDEEEETTATTRTTTTSTTTATTRTSTATKSAKTGDNTPLFLYTLLCMGAITILSVETKRRRKK